MLGGIFASMTSVRLYGPPPYRVAVVHGGPGAPGTVAAVARRLSGLCGIIEPLQTAATLEDQITELHDQLRTHTDQPLVLVGHSWGAWLALLTAARFPDLAAKLILVGSAPFQERYVSQIGERRMSRLSPTEQAEFRQLLQGLGDPATAGKDRLIARLGALVAKADEVDPIAIPTDEQDILPACGDQFQAVWAEAAQLRRTGELLLRAREIRCPVVAIHGDSDPHPAEGVSEPLSGCVARFRFLLLDRCGHSPWRERAAAGPFYQALEAEIRDSLNARRSG